FPEGILHLGVDMLAVDDRIDLEIQFETPQVHVCRSDYRKRVVDNHCLGMDEAFGVQVDLNARFQQGEEIETRRCVDKGGIGTFRYQHTDLLAAKGRLLDGVHHGLVRDEVRRGNVYAFLCHHDGGEIRKHDARTRVVGTSGNNLHEVFVVG